MNTTVYSDYYIFLLEKVGLMESEMRAYSFLFHKLFNTEFKWTIDKDENRAADGEDLRREFEEDVGGLTDDYDPCNMLEMMVALACRCESDIMGVADEDNTRQWFWDMLDNLGLSYYDNSRYNPVAVERILNRLIFRRYDKTGKGGLFPLHNPKSDQREVEIWYQMGSWLNENYDLIG